MKNDFFGIVVFTIAENGCLNGLWTNITVKGEIYNEIAKKEKKSKGISGTYKLTYIEKDGNIYSGTLKIEKDKTDEKYIVTWKVDYEGNGPKNEFEGYGFIIENKLVVTYWKDQKC